ARRRRHSAPRRGAGRPGSRSRRHRTCRAGGCSMISATSITVRVPLKIRRRPGRQTIVTPAAGQAGDGTIPTHADPALVKALARAFRYQKLLDEGRYASISEMAAAERIER